MTYIAQCKTGVIKENLWKKQAVKYQTHSIFLVWNVYNTVWNHLQTTLSLFISFPSVAAGMDPSHHPLAGEPRGRADHARHAAEAGGFPWLPSHPQAAPRAGEVPAGNQLQHPADQAEAQQQARLHALRGQDGVGEQGGFLPWLIILAARHHCRLSGFDISWRITSPSVLFFFHPLKLVKSFQPTCFVIQRK